MPHKTQLRLREALIFSVARGGVWPGAVGREIVGHA